MDYPPYGGFFILPTHWPLKKSGNPPRPVGANAAAPTPPPEGKTRFLHIRVFAETLAGVAT